MFTVTVPAAGSKGALAFKYPRNPLRAFHALGSDHGNGRFEMHQCGQVVVPVRLGDTDRQIAGAR